VEGGEAGEEIAKNNLGIKKGKGRRGGAS